MSGNTFGTLFSVTNFGESHGPAIGCVIDGCPPGMPLSESDIQPDLDRRRPGTSKFVTQRNEPDAVQILSGVYQGLTTGTPICLLINNTDQRSKDYGDIMMTALTVLPSLVLGMTSFTRIIIVLSILRQAMGTQQTPPNQVLIAIALFLSFFIMSPTLNNINKTAVTPYMAEQMSAEDAVMLSGDILKEFMVVNTREDALIMFKDMANDPDYESNADIPFSTLMPAFITSELKTAFQIGFLLFLPFLVIDMVIASILMSLGMMMLSPMLVSLPFKLLLFVLVDGWAMTVGSLAATFMTGAGG